MANRKYCDDERKSQVTKEFFLYEHKKIFVFKKM